MMMANQQLSDEEMICHLSWRLARIHGWSQSIAVPDLVSQINVPDEARARKLCRTKLAAKSDIGYHPGRDEIWIKVPHDDFAHYLRDNCGYSELRIDATLSHFDGF